MGFYKVKQCLHAMFEAANGNINFMYICTYMQAADDSWTFNCHNHVCMYVCVFNNMHMFL